MGTLDPVITQQARYLIETGPEGSATFDESRTYRYRLSRVWDQSRPLFVWCLLNPSTADAVTGDPTLSRVIGFSRRSGAGSVEIVNLFARRCTSPRDLQAGGWDPVGAGNDEAISAAAMARGEVIAGWGYQGTMKNPATGIPRNAEVEQFLADAGIRLRCLRLTKNGLPAHPLYLPRSLRPRDL